MHVDATKPTVKKEGQGKTWAEYDGSDTMSCLCRECVHRVSQIAAKTPF